MKCFLLSPPLRIHQEPISIFYKNKHFITWNIENTFMKTMDITLRSHDVLIEKNNSMLRLFQVQGLDDAIQNYDVTLVPVM